MNLFKKISISSFLVLSILLSACKKVEGPLSDLRPSTPVTVQNAVAYRPEPTVSVSKSAVVSPGVVGPIEIILSIPASSPRTIASITQVAAATSYTQIQSGGTTGFYNTAPIPGSGKTARFKTTLTEYFQLYPVSPSNPAATTDKELARRFYFLITLDDNSTIITEPVRVLVID